MKTRSWSRNDRLSCLPDEVICHILSFLQTTDSVQTCVLSKRWRFLWANVPFLEFGLTGTTVNSKIVTKILLQHKHDIHTFHLHSRVPGCSEDEFKSWIVNITARNVSKLVASCNDFVLPRCIFTSKTLVDLSLTHSGVIPMSGIYLPSLKKLKLDLVRYESHESFSHLISGCPVLEELTVEGEELGLLCVLSPTLTKLVIKLVWGDLFNIGVKLDTPALRYLFMDDCSMPDVLSVGTLDSLVEADVSLWAKPHQDNFSFSRNFLGSLYNVKLLKLSAHRVAPVHDFAFFASGVKFHNLTKLELYSNLGLIRSFLENADNLQAFKIRGFPMVGDVDNQLRWIEPKQVPPCLISHLQSVNLYFHGSKDEFDMASYILMNAKVLEVMEIQIASRKSYWKKRFGVVERCRRRLFENAQECHIVFV